MECRSVLPYQINTCMKLMLFILVFSLCSCSSSKQINSVVQQQAPNSSSSYLQEKEVQLSVPRIEIDSLLFSERCQIGITNDTAITEIYYRSNNKAFRKFTDKILLDSSSDLQFFSHKEGYISSDTIDVKIIKSRNISKVAKATLQPEAHKNYPADGALTLIDFEKGSLNFREGNAWLGFQEKRQKILLEFKEEVTIEKLYVSCLSDHNAWIFLPQEIEVWHDQNLLRNVVIKSPGKAAKSSQEFISVDLPSDSYDQLEIRIVNLSSIPEWHQGKGTLPWLFIDEIIVE